MHSISSRAEHYSLMSVTLTVYMLEGKVGGMERQPPVDYTLPLGLYLKYFECTECHLDGFLAASDSFDFI